MKVVLYVFLATCATAFVAQGNSPMQRGGALKLAKGEKVPMDGDFMVISDGPSPLSAKEVFEGKTVVVFGEARRPLPQLQWRSHHLAGLRH